MRLSRGAASTPLRHDPNSTAAASMLRTLCPGCPGVDGALQAVVMIAVIATGVWQLGRAARHSPPSAGSPYRLIGARCCAATRARRPIPNVGEQPHADRYAGWCGRREGGSFLSEYLSGHLCALRHRRDGGFDLHSFGGAGGFAERDGVALRAGAQRRHATPQGSA